MQALESSEQEISTYLQYLPAIFQQEVDKSSTPFINTYLQYLPAIFQQEVEKSSTPFINGLLLAIEQILRGRDIPNLPGIEELIDRIYTYFEPETLDAAGQPQPYTPAEFLPWLARWVALTLRNDWAEDDRRRFIGHTVPLYRKRGTREGLIEVLQTYVTSLGQPIPNEGIRWMHLGGKTCTLGVDTWVGSTAARRDKISVEDFARPLQIGKASTLGVDTWIGGAPPNYFIVSLRLASADPNRFTKLYRDQSISALIDQHKPAHTYYDLYLSAPTIRLDDREPPVVGKNTYLMSTPIHR